MKTLPLKAGGPGLSQGPPEAASSWERQGEHRFPRASGPGELCPHLDFGFRPSQL